MRAASILVTLSAFVAATSAAALNKRQGPACVMTCIGQESAAVGCTASDAPCLCQSEAFITQVAVCFATGCTAAEADAGVQLGQELCAAVGFSVSIPSAASSALAAGSSASVASTPAASAAPASGSAVSSPAVPSPSGSSAASSPSPSSAAPATSPAPAAAAPASTGGATSLTQSVALAGIAIVGATMTLLA